MSGIGKRFTRVLPRRAWRGLRSTWIGAKFHAHTCLGRYPRLLFPLYALLRLYSDRVVRPDTDLVIEGFPRSASTFCRYAFEAAQGRPVKVASHIHLPAHVIRAVRLGVPVLVLIRPPRDAVASAVVREPYASVRAHLARYRVFYKALEAYRPHIVVAGFDEAVSDFGAVIERLNERFGTAFAAFRHTEIGIAAVNARLDQRHRQFGGDQLTSYRPQPEKEWRKLMVDFRGKEALLAECEALYRRWSPGAGS